MHMTLLTGNMALTLEHVMQFCLFATGVTGELMSL